MGACAGHFQRHRHQASHTAYENFQFNEPNLRRRVTYDQRNTRHTAPVVSSAKNQDILCHSREPFHTILPGGKTNNPKQGQLDGKIRNWIAIINRETLLSPPESLLSLNTLSIRGQQPPRRKTNKEEMIEQKHHGTDNRNACSVAGLSFWQIFRFASRYMADDDHFCL